VLETVATRKFPHSLTRRAQYAVTEGNVYRKESFPSEESGTKDLTEYI